MYTKKRRAVNAVLICMCLATLCFIWGNSAMSPSDSSEASNSLLDAIGPIVRFLGIVLSDDLALRKFAHFAEYSALGIELALLGAVNMRLGFQDISNCAFAGLLTAVTDESIQLLSGRSSQVSDILLDFAGLLTGALLIWLIRHIVLKRRKKHTGVERTD